MQAAIGKRAKSRRPPKGERQLSEPSRSVGFPRAPPAATAPTGYRQAPRPHLGIEPSRRPVFGDRPTDPAPETGREPSTTQSRATVWRRRYQRVVGGGCRPLLPICRVVGIRQGEDCHEQVITGIRHILHDLPLGLRHSARQRAGSWRAMCGGTSSGGSVVYECSSSGVTRYPVARLPHLSAIGGSPSALGGPLPPAPPSSSAIRAEEVGQGQLWVSFIAVHLSLGGSSRGSPHKRPATPLYPRPPRKTRA